jgi:hypothetical protein
MNAILKTKKDFILTGDTNCPRGTELFDSLAKDYKDNIPQDAVTTIDKELHRVGFLPYVIDCMFTTPEYKVGDTVIFTRKGFDKKQWDAIKEEDRNPENEAVKKMITDGLINSNKIEKVEGDVLSFKNAKGTIYTKNKQTILTIVKPKE